MKGRDKQTPEVPAADPFHSLSQFPSKPSGSPHAGDPHSEVTLRQKAEAQVREREERSLEELADLSPKFLRRILHELRVHQIELEMQNEELRRVQAALEAERARYFHIFDLAPVGYVTLDAEGLIVEANLTAANLLGIEQRQLTGKTLSHFILRDDQDIYYQLRRQLANSGRTQTCEVRMGKTADTAFWVHLSATAVPDPDGGPACRVVLSDISERKQADDALRMSEQEFIMLAESVPQLVWMTRPDGWNIYFNQQWVDYTGLTLEESYGHGWSTPFHPDDRQRAQEAWQEATQKDVSYVLECRLRRADGVYRWWLIRGAPRRNAKGEIIKWFGTCTDIEDIKAAEAALAETKAFLQAAMDQSSAGIAIAEAPSGKLSYVNRAGLLIRGASEAEALTGVDAENYVASWKLLQLDGTPMETEDVPLARAVLFGEECRKEFIIRRSANEDRIVLANAAPILDDAGRVAAGIVVFHDITEAKRTEMALALALAEKSALNKEIHHRVKNNLAIMVSLINMQVRQIKHLEALVALRDTKARLLSMALLHEMLYSSGRMDRVEVKGYLESLCGELEQTLGMSAQGVQIRSCLPAALTLRIDQAVPCGLIVSELVTNALKHAFPNDRQGEIMVEMMVEEPDTIMLRVSDSGIGMPDGLNIEQVGTVGLSLVKALARQLEGTLEIQRGLGTLYEIRFPLPPTILP
jgi:PAS domain S-box-containing protein